MVTSCPAYLQVTINDGAAKVEMFRYDVLVGCPNDFDLSFQIPMNDTYSDRMFEIHIHDSLRNYTIHLTSLQLQVYDIIRQHAPVISKTKQDSPWVVVILTVIGTIAIIGCLLLALVYIECSRPKEIHAGKTHGLDSQYHYPKEATSYTINYIHGQNLKKSQVLFIVCYASSRLVYSLLFNFTVFLAIVMVFHGEDVDRLSHISGLQMRKMNESQYIGNEMEKFQRKELAHQVQIVENMQYACDNYIHDLFLKMQEGMYNISKKHQVLIHGNTASISAQMKKLVDSKLNKYKEELDEFIVGYNASVDLSLKQIYAKYMNFIDKVYSNGWLDFPRKFFNLSKSYVDNHDMLNIPPEKEWLSGDQVGFLQFLDVSSVGETQLIPLKFWNR